MGLTMPSINKNYSSPGAPFTKDYLTHHPIRACISNSRQIKQYDVIIHPCPNSNGDLVERPLKLKYG